MVITNRQKIIGMTAALLAVVIIGVYLGFIKNSQQASTTPVQSDKNESAKNATSTQFSECADINDASKRDNCVYVQASKSSDPSACASINNNELLQSCKNNAMYDIAKSDDDCRKISDAAIKNKCFLKVVSFEGFKSCNNSVECMDEVRYNEAVSSGQSARCMVIANQKTRDKCLKATDTATDTDKDGISDYNELNLYRTNPGKADSDNDGYADGQEAAILTDPNNPDTDGDKHKDGEEVRDGFNPCGAGKMPKPDQLASDCLKLKRTK